MALTPKDVTANYIKAIFEKDADAMLALYSETVTIFDMWELWAYKNRAEWEQAVKGWFGSLDAERTRVSFDSEEWHIVADQATFHAFVTYTAIDTEGNELRSMTNRLTWVLANTGTRWQIIHEHTSAPIQMDGMKVLLSK